MDDFFSFVSKAVLIVPIFILITSLLIKFNVQNKPILNVECSGQACLTPTIKPIAKNNDFKFNLQGPIVCDNLFIQNKKVFLENETTHYLLNGDCLYIWEKGKAEGEKKCSLSNYVNLAENYLGFFDTDDLINNNLVKGFIKDKNINLADVIKSCKQENIKDSSVFEIPVKILFKAS